MTLYVFELTGTIRVKTRITVTGAKSQAEAEAFAASASAEPARKQLWHDARPDLADTPRQISAELVRTLKNSADETMKS